MSAVVRLARPDDLAHLERIENDADALLRDLLAPPTWWPAPTGDERAGEPGFLLVADAGDAAIAGGDAIAGFVHVLETGGHAHLEQVSVAPAHARRGYGRLLVEGAKDRARALGYARLTLRTFAEVPWDAPFYARLGFVETPPDTAFLRGLVDHEAELGIDALGRRVQMTAQL
ncbi:MAG: GNAT family N-acetyltransferase [Microbacterium arborescens]